MPVIADPNTLLARLPLSPDVYLQKLDLTRQALLAIEFHAQAYQAASFLDDRILAADTRGAWLPMQDVIEAARRTQPQPVHFIFHSGHVGSTLISRLLDETGSVLSLREPLLLRNLADANDTADGPDSLIGRSDLDTLLAGVLRLWGRGYEGTQCVVVKATSSASRLWAPLMSASPGARALWLNLGAERYLATLLGGQNSSIDLRGHAPIRMRRLQALTQIRLRPVHDLSLGELAAMSWLVERWTQQEASERSAAVLTLDFDEFLTDVRAAMRSVIAHFGLKDCEDFVSRVASSPSLNRYSKAPNVPYSPALRLEVLRESRRINAQQIAVGLRWLESLAAKDAAVAGLLSG